MLSEASRRERAAMCACPSARLQGHLLHQGHGGPNATTTACGGSWGRGDVSRGWEAASAMLQHAKSRSA